ncbi:sigma-70 family RNA polymerase sigma factor [Labrys okinawensis]|uniref:sigma-70 family RNA polymerase sigma factor n=1 Tax=Labrys okinawensis TaxID=346911 RepID=UPI0039BC6A0A
MIGQATISPTNWPAQAAPRLWGRLAAWLKAPWLQAVLSVGADASGRARAAPPDAAALSRFQAMMLPHLDAAHNLARFLCRDADAAEDIVQEAFLRAFRGFADYRGGSPRAWILTIVRNCHHSWWQEQKRGRTEPLDGGLTEEGEPKERTDLPHEEANPESSLLERDQAAEVRAVLGALPEAFREILVLRELEDLSYREISEVTTTPLGTVMSRLARARALFAEAWKRRQAAREAA